MKYRKGVFFVVYREEMGKILYLVLKRKLHWKGWEFPKAGIEKNEDIIKAIKRETKEETGQNPVNIKKYDLKGRFKYDKEYGDRPGIIGQDWILYSVEIKNKKIKLDKIEHLDYKWVEFGKAVKILSWVNQRACLEAVNRDLLNLELKKFRQYKTSCGSMVVGGKNAEQNEELVRKFMGKENIIMHTKAAGSPFCVILGKRATKKDLKKTAIFCAKYSRDWKKNKSDVEIHIFSGKEVYKNKKMKKGTFGVKKFKKIIIKKREIEKVG